MDRTFEKKIDVTFAGGPSFSKNTSLGIGLLAAGLYRLDRTDSVTVPSDVSVFANVSVSGFYALGVTGNTIFAHNRQRVNYTVMFSSAPRSLWASATMPDATTPRAPTPRNTTWSRPATCTRCCRGPTWEASRASNTRAV